MNHITIGSRGSKLALWQTNWVKGELERLHPGLQVNIEIISTKGDRVLDVSLPKLGEQGKGLFTKELEEAIHERRADLAVHSLKDLPTELPAGLHIGAISAREDVRDALVFAHLLLFLGAALRSSLGICNQHEGWLARQNDTEQGCNGGQRLSQPPGPGASLRIIHGDNLRRSSDAF